MKGLRKEREMRRQAILKESIIIHEEIKCEYRRKILIDKLIKTSNKEKCLSAQLLQRRIDKKVYTQNIINKSIKYEEVKTLELQRTKDHEQNPSSINKILNAASLHKKKTLHEILRLNNQEIKYNQHFLICKRIVEDIVDLSLMHSEIKDLYGDITQDIYDEKMDMFLCHVPLFPQGVACCDFFDFQSQMDFADYLNSEKVWKYSSSIGSSNLNFLLSMIFDIANSNLPKDFYAPCFPQFSLKICILGGPYSGKSTCCHMLSSVYKLHVIAIANVIEEAIKAFKDSESLVFESKIESQNEQKNSFNVEEKKLSSDIWKEVGLTEAEQISPNNIIKKLTMRADLGRQAMESLELGCPVKDEVMVEMLVEYIRRIVGDCSGWILDGFPCTMNQLILLEKAFTGQDPLQDVKESFQSQLLFPVEKEQKIFKSSIDAALFMDVSDDVIINRSHVDHGSNDDILSGQGEDNMQVLQGLEFYRKEMSKLMDWFRCHGRVGVLNESTDCEGMSKEGIKILNDVMIQLSLAYIEIEKSVKDNPSHDSLFGDPMSGECKDDVQKNFDLQKSKPFSSLHMSTESAKLTLDLWGCLEDNYVRGCKLALRWLRSDDQEVVSYFSQLRNNLKEMFRVPDCLGICLLQFQNDFNAIPAILRGNVSIKAELCQRVDELQVKLWSLSDEKRKKMETQICLCSNDQYLESYICSVYSHLMHLVHTETSKLENVMNLLKDVYCYAQGTTDLVSFTSEFQTIFKPHIIDDAQESNRNKKKNELPDDKSGKLKAKKEDGSSLCQMPNVLSAAQTFLDKMNEISESMNNVVEPQEEFPKKKSQTSSSSAVNMSTLEYQENEDMLDNRMILMKELYICMKSEISITTERLTMIEHFARKYTERMLMTKNSILNLFTKSVGTNYLSEMQNIDLVCEVARNCSEHGYPISELLSFNNGEFFMDQSFSIPTLLQENNQITYKGEKKSSDEFTICQLFGLFHKFAGIAPTGLVSVETFQSLLQQIASDGGLPNQWMINLSQNVEMASCSSMYNDEFISWRKFLLLVMNPIWPVDNDLLGALSEFKKLDQMSSGSLTKEQFLKTNLWLDRKGTSVKGFFFHLYACHQNIPSLLDYETFLLNFCLDENPLNGLSKALKLASTFEDKNQCPDNGEAISVKMLYKVLYPLPLMRRQHSRFCFTESKMAELLRIYKDLGAKSTGEKLAITLLTEHPLYQKVSRNSCIFWLNSDFRK